MCVRVRLRHVFILSVQICDFPKKLSAVSTTCYFHQRRGYWLYVHNTCMTAATTMYNAPALVPLVRFLQCIASRLPLPVPPLNSITKTLRTDDNRVVVMIIGRLSESMPQGTKRLVLVPLLDPLSLFWGPRSGNVARRRCPISSKKLNSRSGGSSGKAKPTTTPTPIVPVGGGGASGEAFLNKAEGVWEGEGRSDDGEIASEEALGRCVEDLEKLLTAAPARPALLGLLSEMRILVPVFRLYCFCKT